MSFNYDQSKRFVMVSNHPYYPSVQYFATKAEAESEAEKERETMHEPSGDKNSQVFVAEVVTMHEIKTSY